MSRVPLKPWFLTPLVLVACSAITAKTGYQCESTVDCQGRTGDFAGTVCIDGVCQRIVAPEPASQACTSHVDCTFALGTVARCVDAQCVQFPSECDARGNVVAEDGVLLGVLRPATPGSLGSEITRALPDLVGATVDEWNIALDAVANEGSPSPARAGVLVCDEADIRKAAGHFRSFRVKAIVGPLTEPALITLRDEIKSEIPILSPTGDAPSFTEVVAVGQPWFCSLNLADAVDPFVELVQQVVRATEKDREHDAKVAFAYNGWAAGEKAFFERTKQKLGSVSTFSDFDVDTALTTEGTPNILVSATKIVQSVPDVVVMSSGAWARRLVSDVEARWAAFNGGAPRPVYVVMRTLPDLEEVLKSYNWPRKVYALDVARDDALGSNYDALVSLLAGENNTLGLRAPFAAAAYSDCLLSALYGIFKAQVANPESAVRSLGAEEISAGLAAAGGTGSAANNINLTTLPTHVDTGLNLLRAQSSLTRMTGTNAVYGFDATTHVPSVSLTSFTSYCLSAQLGNVGANWRRVTFTEDAGAPSCP